MKSLKIIIACLFISSSYALEIDEKLTLRIVKTSDTKKTVLINRGQEDGLAKGDHAKFYLSVGVVARGVVIKVSPTRSVWALYRLVNADYIKDDQVMKLKVTAPVKITKDESRDLVGDDVPSRVSKDPRDLGIPLASGAEDMELERELSDGAGPVFVEAPIQGRDLTGSSFEAFGSFYYDSQSSTVTENNGAEFSGTDMTMILDAGLEYFFDTQSRWLSRISLLGAFRMLSASTLAYEGTEVQESGTLFGLGTNVYPLVRPNVTNRIIPFGQFMYFTGSVKSNYSIQNPSTATVGNQELSAGVTMISFAGGAKYLFQNGFGVSAKLEYQSRVDSYNADASSVTWDKKSSGPKVLSSFSYRF